MKQQIIKILLFIISFVIALNIISAIMNKGNTDLTVEMSKATLPTVSMLVEGQTVNCLHGYTQEMEANYLRDTVTPLPDSRKLSVLIDPFEAEIQQVSYEVRSLDTTRLVENTQVYNLSQDGDSITAELNIKDLIDQDEEYILVLILKLSDSREVRYYTRIIQRENIPVAQQLKFVKSFHEKTFDSEKAKELTTYLESNEEGDNTTLQHVTIHSNFNQIIWGKLPFKEESNPEISILEIDSSIAAVKLNYTVALSTDTGIDRFLVEEYYRIRYTTERVYLLDFDRTMNQIFDPDGEVFANDKVMLGITNGDVDFAENTDGSVVAFVQQNALYAYKNGEGKLARLFSFYDEKNNDKRVYYNNHHIKILSIDEAGNVRFMIYGYMNRGRHEGQVGISVYYYDTNMNAIEEEVYIPCNKSAGLLKENVENMSYINRQNSFYFYMNETIYCIRLEDNSYTEVVKNVTEDHLITSKSNQMIAWQDENGTGKIQIMDLNTGKITTLDSQSGEMVHPLGFVGEDLVYGISNANDMIRDTAGIIMTPMHTICIQDNKGNELKNYHIDGVYVTSVVINDNTIQMKRVKRLEETGELVVADDDQIMNSQAEEQTKNKITEVVTQDREKVVEIELPNNITTANVKLLTPKEVLFEGGRSLALPAVENQSSLYYVYAQGEIAGIFEKPYQAVNKAAGISGVVVNDGQEYIWQKGNRVQRVQIDAIEAAASDEEKSSLAVCLDAILVYENSPRNAAYQLEKGDTAMSLMQENIEGEVLDLSGCELDSVLYYVSQKTPVLASIGNEESVLIVGYDEKNTIIMDPSTGKIYKKGMNDSRDLFKTYGNEFIAYVKK